MIFPPLAGNPVVQQAGADTLIRVVLAGTQAAQTERAPTAAAMPSFAWRLNDAEVADVLTYIRNSWGNAGQRRPGRGDESRAVLRGGKFVPLRYGGRYRPRAAKRRH